MKRSGKLGAVIAALILAVMPMASEAQPRAGFHHDTGEGSAGGYYVSLALDYNVPCGDVYEMHRAGVVDEDMPTILYIYTHSQYSLRQIYSLRLRGATWENLSNWCGVPPYTERGGPPHGNAYGHYRQGASKHRDDPRQRDGDNDE